MRALQLGVMPYRDAWRLQETIHNEVVEGAEERLILVEHPPVITVGRRPGISKNLLASKAQLSELGIDLVESDRGGDITFHGPGQLVAYPIVRLNDHRLSVGGYVRKLEQTVIAALHELNIPATKDQCAVGVWVPIPPTNTLAKICALGVRIRRGVSMHGIALNVTTDLRYFNLIIPCGLTGRSVTSIQQLLGETAPSIDFVCDVITRHFLKTFAVGATLVSPFVPSQYA